MSGENEVTTRTATQAKQAVGRGLRANAQESKVDITKEEAFVLDLLSAAERQPTGVMGTLVGLADRMSDDVTDDVHGSVKSMLKSLVDKLQEGKDRSHSLLTSYLGGTARRRELIRQQQESQLDLRLTWQTGAPTDQDGKEIAYTQERIQPRVSLLSSVRTRFFDCILIAENGSKATPVELQGYMESLRSLDAMIAAAK